MLKAVIMAGGKGERLWPLSTEKRPKQLLRLFSGRTLIEETVERLLPIIPKKYIFIVADNNLAAKIKKIIPGVNFIIEPMPKGTAACICLAALHLHPEDIMIIETSDHVYNDVRAYHDYLRQAIAHAKDDAIVLLGITPSRPHTGFGYIEIGKNLSKNAYAVTSFREKPNLKTARKYAASGKFLWNSGVFIAKAKVMLDTIREFMPKTYHSVRERNFSSIEPVSIDKGVMEKKRGLVVINAAMHWDDVGDLLSIGRIAPKDSSNNACLASHVGIDTENCIIAGNKFIATIGVKNLIIVSSEEAVLVCDRKRWQEIGKLAKRQK